MGAAVVVAAIAVSAAVLLSDDETVRQQVGLQVISLRVHGDGLDPRYAAAARRPGSRASRVRRPSSSGRTRNRWPTVPRWVRPTG